MSVLSQSIVLFFACLSITACSQTICSDGSAGNCGSVAAGADGGGANISCDDPNAVVCDSQCVDTDVDPTYCGSCDDSCEEGQGCSAGSCVDLCEAGQINCGGVCIDPDTNGQFCGASGTCSIDTNGTDCGANSCIAGTCATQRYVGSLPTTTGRWNYNGAVGVAGAEAACRTTYPSAPTAVVCSFDQLLQAQTNGELIGATDNAANPVDAWYVVDPARNAQLQCTKTNGENLPWTYPTADLGERAAYVTLDSTTGNVSAVIESAASVASGCGAQRFVPCCLP